jgi:GT2 family glycosyltransferase
MISIAMATYNGERFLGEQLCSLATQTLLPKEVVICDDISTAIPRNLFAEILGLIAELRPPTITSSA